MAEQHPDLAGRFTALRDDLDSADDRAEPYGGDDGRRRRGRSGRAEPQLERRVTERRREAAEAFDRVIAEIRATPGFHGFLRPSPVCELAAAAAEGPVVVVNVSRFGSHALILTGSGVLEPVPLAGLTPERVYERVAGFLSALDDASSPTAARLAGRRPSSGW